MKKQIKEEPAELLTGKDAKKFLKKIKSNEQIKEEAFAYKDITEETLKKHINKAIKEGRDVIIPMGHLLKSKLKEMKNNETK